MDTITYLIATAVISLGAGAIQVIGMYRRHLTLIRGSSTGTLPDVSDEESPSKYSLQLWPITRKWFWFTATTSTIVLFFFPALGLFGSGLLSYVMSVMVIPLVTFLIAFPWPIPWGLAASAVTVLHGASQLAARLAGANFAQGDLDTMADAYIWNVVVVSLVVSARSHRVRGA